MTVLINLVGEQPFPNLLVTRYEKPEGTVLVSTELTHSVARRLEGLLRSEIAVEHLRMDDPFDIPRIRESLREHLASLSICRARGSARASIAMNPAMETITKLPMSSCPSSSPLMTTCALMWGATSSSPRDRIWEIGSSVP